MKQLNKIHITGRVKEIDFFYYAQIYAHKHHINGFIQNGIPNHLYLEIEGSPEKLDVFKKSFLNGFLSANIESVSVEEGEIAGYTNFERIKDSKP